MKTLANIAKATLALAVIATASASFISCAGTADDKAAANDSVAPATKTADSKKEPMTNIRYIDGDSITANYELAKDLQTQNLATLSKLQSTQQAKTAEIEKFAKSMETKKNNNQYTTEESFNTDYTKYLKMQQDAATALETMQRNAEQELARQQAELNDSVESFIKEYNKTKGYDAILLKAAGIYFNPALDITDDVIKGLNERYKKSKAK